MEIRLDDLSGSAIRALLRDHLQSATLYSPAASIHALDLVGLRQPEISFWTAWEAGELLGCGALKALDDRHGEVKSMRTAAPHLRRGVALAMLRYIASEAERRGYRRLNLETGSHDAFGPARALYTSFGFTYCGPFAQYAVDPYSVFMTKVL